MSTENFHTFPETRTIELELTSKCTVKCPSCPRELQKDVRNLWDNGNVDSDKLIDFIHDTHVNLWVLAGAYGDGLYHPQLVEVITAIKESGSHFTFDTNGSYRKKEDWEQIARLMDRQDKVIFSVDGSPDNFTQYRVNADWKTIQVGMKTLAEYKCKTTWKYIVFKYNQSYECMRDAYEKAIENGIFQFAIVHTHRAPEHMLADKEEFDENLCKLEEYAYLRLQQAKDARSTMPPKLKIQITPRTNVFKVQDINKRINNVTVPTTAPQSDVVTKTVQQPVRQKRIFAETKTVAREPFETESLFPQCMNVNNYANFVSSEGYYLPCCFMRVGQQKNLSQAGLDEEDMKSLSIYNYSREQIINGPGYQKIMRNFENMEVCHNTCSKSRVN